MKRIIETGHYYAAKGPTAWSTTGITVMQQIRRRDDKSMLFVDDVHPLTDVSEIERFEDTVVLDFTPDYLVLESKMFEPAKEVLYQLLHLECKKKRAQRNEKDGKYYISGFPITTPDGVPLCVLLDAALTVHKYELGFKNVINVLPSFYEQQQSNLLRILNKLQLPDLIFSVILFERTGNFQQMNGYEHLKIGVEPIAIPAFT